MFRCSIATLEPDRKTSPWCTVCERGPGLHTTRGTDAARGCGGTISNSLPKSGDRSPTGSPRRVSGGPSEVSFRPMGGRGWSRPAPAPGPLAADEAFVLPQSDEMMSFHGIGMSAAALGAQRAKGLAIRTGGGKVPNSQRPPQPPARGRLNSIIYVYHEHEPQGLPWA
jgi:hypothetical protein